MTSGAAVPGRLWRDDDRETFEATLVAAAAELGVQPLAVEKDYWVCEALRAVSGAFPDHIIFKGGTSLEKLRIIQRFSEDLDLLVTATYSDTKQGKAALKAMVAAAATSMQSAPSDAVSGGLLGAQHRRAYVSPPLEVSDASSAGLADPGRVLVELGQSGGSHPSELATVTSLLTRQLDARGFPVGDWDDLRPFDVQILHPGRTLIEKLLRINNFCVDDQARESEHGWPRIGRQFYDLYQLLGDARTLELLTDSPLASSVLADCYRISEMFSGDQPVPAGGFAACPAFEVGGELAEQLRGHHDEAMRTLYYGLTPGPTFDDVVKRVHDHAALLNIRHAGADT